MSPTYLKNPYAGTYAYKVMETGPVHLRAVIFDCDGVLVDSEPLHYSAFKKVLGVDGHALTEEIYKETFLSMDDKGAISKFFEIAKKPLTVENLNKLMEQKTQIYQDLVSSEGLLPFPAVPELIMSLSQRYPLAVASGARRHEVETILESAGLRPYFEVIVTSDDISNGKPHPESFLKVVEELNASGKRNSPIRAEECVVIEDSIQCITAAHAIGMKCIAVATTHMTFELKGADLVVPSLSALRASQLEDLFQTRTPLPSPIPQKN
jgi:beta-phosphoglucomutase